MTIEEAYRLLPEYMDGGLSPLQRADLERLLEGEPALQEAVALSEQMDSCLRAQPWLEPHADFTSVVLFRTELEPLVVERPHVAWWEWGRLALSVAAVIVVVALYGQPLLGRALESLGMAGDWLGDRTGYMLFALHPVVLLGLIMPVVAGGYATCVLTGRCRLSS